MSTNFIIFGPIDKKLCVFEIFRRSLGRVRDNEVELTKMPKNGRRRRKKRR